MLPTAPGRRRPWIWRFLALSVFGAALIFGPLTENGLADKVFASCLLLTTTAALLLATGRVAFSLLLAGLVFGAIALAGTLKFAYLTTPLLAPDLKYFVNRETIEVVSRYPLLLTAAVAAALALPILPLLAFFAERDGLMPDRAPGVRRTARGAGTLAALVLFAACLAPTGPFRPAFNKPMWVTINDRSFITNFFTSFNDTQIAEPAIPAGVDRSIDWRLDRPLRAPPQKPDVVAILEESTFDPRLLRMCSLPVCRYPMFERDRQTRAGGLLNVHTFGGGTWTSEFAFLTGLADKLFGNAGLYAPYNLAPRVAFTLPRAFEAAGYRTVAIYPVTGDFLNARNAYALYGFDAFHDGSDYGLGWESTDADLLAVFRQIYAQERLDHPDRPLFVFMLTLHQHGPHMTPLALLPAPFDTPLFEGRFAPRKLDEWLNLNLGNYLERLRQSDAMLAELERYLLGRKQPTVLLHFGDHQPSFDGAIQVIPKKLPKGVGPNSSLVTYFMLKTNYPMPLRADYPITDIVYLGSLLLESAGIPRNPFYQANTLLRERCKGRYLDCADTRILASYHDHLFNRLNVLRDE
ncbi:LTA synthase family protein [Dokdonella koreensis]|uniref:Sulfatase n=1 Tax=Dokdonella koreensis DS-123 TaxID=1300342 RepID=A0A160DRT6_9GAMM|nr:LTA synthase family protein [Dokdonella koreensis]ANB16939.1 Sulfatase [Dokdonella koreensis DS-123]